MLHLVTRNKILILCVECQNYGWISFYTLNSYLFTFYQVESLLYTPNQKFLLIVWEGSLLGPSSFLGAIGVPVQLSGGSNDPPPPAF